MGRALHPPPQAPRFKGSSLPQSCWGWGPAVAAEGHVGREDLKLCPSLLSDCPLMVGAPLCWSLPGKQLFHPQQLQEGGTG